jgi:hypothetical protein
MTPAIVAECGPAASAAIPIVPIVVSGLWMSSPRSFGSQSEVPVAHRGQHRCDHDDDEARHHTIAFTMALDGGDGEEDQDEHAKSLAMHVLANRISEQLTQEHRRNRDSCRQRFRRA